MASVGTSAVKIIDNDGDVVTVTSNKLDVNATLVAGAAINIGDVQIVGNGSIAHFAQNVTDSAVVLTDVLCKQADIMV